MKTTQTTPTPIKKNGFTLVELLIVISIIGIIATIAIPAMRDMKSNAQLTKMRTLIKAIEEAKTRAVVNNEATPATVGSGSRSWATWPQFGKYLKVNGTTVTDVTEITYGSKNGTGRNIYTWGSYMAADGSLHTLVEFHSTWAPLEN